MRRWMIFLLLSVCSWAAPPKTVRDYFLALPSKYFQGDRQALLQSKSAVLDVANGYLKTPADGGQAGCELALFKRRQGDYVIALSTQDEMGYRSTFLSYQDGQWSEVSGQLVPAYSKRKYYQLPRQGTTLEVFALTEVEGMPGATDLGVSLGKLGWDGARFVTPKGR
jgi:hypothetical protein